MKRNITTDFLTVTRRNMAEVTALLRDRKGSILIGKPGSGSFPDHVVDLDLDLFDHPVIEVVRRRRWLENPRGSKQVRGETWQTGYENDRSYTLRRTPKKSRDAAVELARSFAERKNLGPYDFKIGFQAVSSTSFPNKGEIALYIPKGRSRRAAFAYLLSMLIAKINAELEAEGEIAFRFNRAHIEEILEYVLSDLQNGKVFRSNVEAGMEADALMG